MKKILAIGINIGHYGIGFDDTQNKVSVIMVSSYL